MKRLAAAMLGMAARPQSVGKPRLLNDEWTIST